MLTEGSKAPAWKGSDQHGKEHSSDETGGMWYILYFYPEDDTPGCTKEACGFRDAFQSLSKRLTIFGVSGDSAESHKKFAEKYSLPFTLLADPKKTIIAAYGADGTFFKSRVTFLIDPEGTIRKIYQGFDCATHATEIDADFESLSSKNPESF